MSLIPKITTDDVSLVLHGAISSNSGSYTFWGQSVSSGSILAQINMANIFLYGALGYSTMDSGDTIKANQVRACELDYACARVITLLSGDVIVDGFSFTSGLSVSQPLLLATYRNLQSAFLNSAQTTFRTLQTIAVRVDADVTQYRDTAPSIF